MSKEFDSVSMESNGLSPMTLQTIREQMALSLKRMRQLEEQVKIIPILEIQLTALKAEKRQLEEQVKIKPLLEIQLTALRAEKEQLVSRIKEEEKLRLNNINYINNNVCSRSRSWSLTRVDSGREDDSDNRRNGSVSPTLTSPARRDFGVMCGVVTRNIGVGHQIPKTKTVATATPGSGDKWLPQKLDFLIGNENSKRSRTIVTVAKGSQTVPFGYKSINTQTNSVLHSHNTTQTPITPVRSFDSIGISVYPHTSNANTQIFVPSKSVGVSDDSINNILCLKCTGQKQTVGTNTDDHSPLTHSVSLAQLSRPKLEGAVEENIKTSTVGCQYDIRGWHRYTQCEIDCYARSCQTEGPKLSNKGVQNDFWWGISKSTDTNELVAETEDRGCDAEICKTSDASCGTDESVIGEYSEKLPERSEKSEAGKKEDVIVPSRIPRLNSQRKFERQITYTKIASSVTPG